MMAFERDQDHRRFSWIKIFHKDGFLRVKILNTQKIITEAVRIVELEQ